MAICVINVCFIHSLWEASLVFKGDCFYEANKFIYISRLPELMAKGRGYAKVILFGEHFVVYGLPAIASAIDRYVEIRIEKTNTDDVIFEDRVFKEKISKNKNPSHISCKLFDAMFGDFNITGIKVAVSATAIPKAGMGYSAAFNVALVRAINDYLSLGLSNEEVNKIAYKGECIAHGNPSGIDNTCATYGSLVWFEKDLKGNDNKFVLFKPKSKLFLILVDSGIKHSTKEIINEVRQKRKREPERFKKIFDNADDIVNKVKLCLENGDLVQLGLLMNQNQELLRQIGVSCEELENLVTIALNNGALGAKITGAGKGGLIVVLCKNKEHQKLISKIFERADFKSIKADIA